MKRILLFILLLPVFCAAQSQRIGVASSNAAGFLKVLPGAAIKVCESQNSPTCSVPIYSDSGLLFPLPNPIYADNNGNYQYYAANGTYWEQVCSTTTGCFGQSVGFTAGGDFANPPPIGVGTPNTVWTSNLITASPQYDVRIAGAKCDNLTDDSVNLQKAVNLVEAGAATSPAVLYVPPGLLCKFSTSLIVTSSVTFRGVSNKIHPTGSGNQKVNGSGLVYTGTGDAIVVQNGNSATFTYFVSFEDLYLGATGPAASIVHLYNTEGPARFLRTTIDGGGSAAVGVKCFNCQFQVSFVDDYIQFFTTYGLQFNAGGPILVDNVQIFDIGQDITGAQGTGIFASGVNELNLKHSYFELMPIALEITNDDENYGDYNIEGNYFNNWGSGTAQSFANTANQRCIKLHSTSDSLPMLTQGRIVGNSCHLGPVFAQGISPYAFEFDTASNMFRQSGSWKFTDNQVSGITTAALTADSPLTSVFHANNFVTTLYDVGSTAPVLLPDVAGSGSYTTPVVADSVGAVSVSGGLTLNQTGTATAIASFPSNFLFLNTSYWTGSAAAMGSWFCQASEATGANPPGQLACNYSGSAGSHVLGFPGITSLAANPAALGFLRLAKTETINYRNNANNNDLALGINGSDGLSFNTHTFLSSAGTLGGGTTTLNTGSAVYASKRNVTGCTTGATAGNACASAVTVTWPASFADTNYSAGCTPVGAPTNFPGAPYVVAKAVGSMTVNYIANTSAAAAWPNLDCWATHD